MTFTEIKEEILKLEPVDQERLATFLTVLRLNRDEDFQREIAGRVAEDSPGAWVNWEEAKRMIDADD